MVVSMPLEELWTLITAMIRSMALWSKPFWLAWPASLDQIQPDIIFGTKMVQRTKGLQSQTHLPHGFLIEQRFFPVNDKIQFQVPPVTDEHCAGIAEKKLHLWADA